MIVFEANLWCDSCGRCEIVKWPKGAQSPAEASSVVRDQMPAAAWQHTNGKDKCPICVARDKYGPAQWTAEHNPDHVMRLEGGRGMSDTCPLCGGEMLDDTPKTLTTTCLVQRCADCDYWEEETPVDGIPVAVGHEPEEGT